MDSHTLKERTLAACITCELSKEETMTTKEACEYLSISRATLNRHIARKRLTPLNQKTSDQERIPAYLFARDDVEKLAADYYG